MSSIHLLGIDTGGTFTDFVYLTADSFKVHKVLSTPDAPQQAIQQGIADLGLMDLAASADLLVIHGTTVATNATLQKKGVRTAYIANRGLSDVLLIGRQTRTRLYSLEVAKPQPPIDEQLLFEVDARLDAKGNEVTSLDQAQLQQLQQQITRAQPEAIAINLLFSFINDAHERQIEELFSQHYFVSRSSFVLPEYREYERGIVTWVNAWIGPLIEQYMLSVKDILAPSTVSIMQSSGITIAADQAAKRAVNLLLSGPAGGLSAARMFQPSNLITFDMGGTSTDVSLLTGGIRLSSESVVADLPIAVPMADIHTIGAGGGSIATVDAGGLLQVGPQSAGAHPGPACYAQGGTLPTVTDANLILGRLRPGAFLGGRMQLDVGRAQEAVQTIATLLDTSVEQAALGIVSLANEHMVQALRYISIQQGYNPSDFTLVCFGGAGGLHLCALAEAMDIKHAVIPVMSGVLSALGMLASNPGRELTKTHRVLLANLDPDQLSGYFTELLDQGKRELRAEGISTFDSQYSLDLRFLGQTFTINVPYTGLDSSAHQFHALHRQRYGHTLDKPVELLNIRVHLEAERDSIALPKQHSREQGLPLERVELPMIADDVPVYRRADLGTGQQFSGPALIIDDHATSLIYSGWETTVDEEGTLRLLRVS
jgi:N-methylhydantoinase A